MRVEGYNYSNINFGAKGYKVMRGGFFNRLNKNHREIFKAVNNHQPLQELYKERKFVAVIFVDTLGDIMLKLKPSRFTNFRSFMEKMNIVKHEPSRIKATHRIPVKNAQDVSKLTYDDLLAGIRRSEEYEKAFKW